MSLTYTQKQFIQNHYPDKSIEEISKELEISTHKIQKHIDKNAKFFENKEAKIEAKGDVELFSFSSLQAWFKQNYVNLLVLTFFVVIAYMNSFGAEFVSDDIQGIVELENQLKQPSYIWHNTTFIPHSILFYLSYQIGGLTPIAFRIWNLLFHVGNVWLVYILVPFFFRKQTIAFIAASLMAIHPMMIESVTWISGGIYAQAAFFLLLSFLFYIKSKEKKSTSYVIFSCLSFVLALTNSEKVIILPFIILAYEFSFGNLFKRWMYSIPYFGISFGWGLIMLTRVSERVEYLQRTNGTERAIQFYNPLVQIPVALSKYFQLYLWPFGNTLYHSEFRMTFALYVYTLVVAIVFLALWFFAFKKNKRIFFWISFFFISLLPTMNPFGLSWIVAERYAYLGSVGIYITFAFLIYKLIESKTYKIGGYILLTAILIGLTVRTLWRNSEWKNVDTLWIATGKTSPSDPKTHNNLGDMYARHGNMEMAIKEFTAAIELNPNYAAAWYNRGNTYKYMKDDENAFKNFATAIEKDPTIWQGYMNIAVIQFNRGDLDNAEANLRKAIELNPVNAALYSNLGVVLYTKGNPQEALQYLAKALEVEPENQFAQEWYKKVSENPVPQAQPEPQPQQ